MEGRFTTEGWALPARFAAMSVNWRYLGSILLGVIGSTLIARGEVLAQKKLSVDLSPLIAKSTLTSHTDPAKEISVIFVLPLSDLQGATAYAERVNTPKDEFFGKYLTPSQFAATYGGSEADYNSLESWAKTNGLKVSQRSVSRTTLTVRGTVAQFEALFNTQINNYRSPDGKEFYSASSQPTIPSGIPTTVIGIIGLSRRPAGFGGISGTAQITTTQVSWAPSSGGTGYLIQVSPTNGSTVDDYLSKSTSVEWTGLAPKTSYVVAVVALNPSGARQAANVILTTN